MFIDVISVCGKNKNLIWGEVHGWLMFGERGDSVCEKEREDDGEKEKIFYNI